MHFSNLFPDKCCNYEVLVSLIELVETRRMRGRMTYLEAYLMFENLILVYLKKLNKIY